MPNASGDEGGGRRAPKKKVDPETLDFIYDHTKEGPNLQFRDSEHLDTKITAVFAAATAAIGFATRLPKTEGPLGDYVVASWSGRFNLVDACFYLAVASWLVVVVVTLLHLRTKSHHRAIRADVLWTPKYRHYSPDRVKRRVVVDIREAYKHNKKLLDGKARTFNRAISWAAAEGVFIVLALVLARAGG